MSSCLACSRLARLCRPFETVARALGRCRSEAPGPGSRSTSSTEQTPRTVHPLSAWEMVRRRTGTTRWEGSSPGFLFTPLMENQADTNMNLGFPPFGTKPDASHVPSDPLLPSARGRGEPPKLAEPSAVPQEPCRLPGPPGTLSPWAPI